MHEDHAKKTSVREQQAAPSPAQRGSARRPASTVSVQPPVTGNLHRTGLSGTGVLAACMGSEFGAAILVDVPVARLGPRRSHHCPVAWIRAVGAPLLRSHGCSSWTRSVREPVDARCLSGASVERAGSGRPVHAGESAGEPRGRAGAGRAPWTGVAPHASMFGIAMLASCVLSVRAVCPSLRGPGMLARREWS